MSKLKLYKLNIDPKEQLALLVNSLSKEREDLDALVLECKDLFVVLLDGLPIRVNVDERGIINAAQNVQFIENASVMQYGAAEMLALSMSASPARGTVTVVSVEEAANERVLEIDSKIGKLKALVPSGDFSVFYPMSPEAYDSVTHADANRVAMASSIHSAHVKH